MNYGTVPEGIEEEVVYVASVHRWREQAVVAALFLNAT
jgi:hypothetical protein